MKLRDRSWPRAFSRSFAFAISAFLALFTFSAFADNPHPPGGISSGLTFWLKASDLTGVADGAAVQEWVERSGTGKKLTPDGAAPTFLAAGIDGKPAVRFDNGKRLKVEDLDLNLVNDFTAFLVRSDEGATTSNSYFFHLAEEVNGLQTIALYRNQAGNEKFIVKASGNWTQDYISAAAGITPGQTYQTTYVRSGSNLHLYRDGALLKTDAGTAGPLQEHWS